MFLERTRGARSVLSHWSIATTGMDAVPRPGESRGSPSSVVSVWLRSRSCFGGTGAITVEQRRNRAGPPWHTAVGKEGALRNHRLLGTLAASCAVAGGLAVTAGTATAASPAGFDENGCRDEYTGACVEMTDNNCDDIRALVLLVDINVDPLGLDGNDNDGRGCESYPPGGGNGGAGGNGGGDDNGIIDRPGDNGDGLAETGSSSPILAGGAALTLAAGGLLLVAARRRTA